jgi:hypothetical protein
VRVGHDVAVGVDEDAGSDGVLPHDARCVRAITLPGWSESGYHNLHDRRRHPAGQLLQRIVELRKHARRQA